jgi:Co/Zn/Cd efflux system component
MLQLIGTVLLRHAGTQSIRPLHMRSVWICSRNDAIGNLAVLLAAAGVFGTGTGWPDLIVATIMAALGISGGLQIIRQAAGELRTVPAAAPAG